MQDLQLFKKYKSQFLTLCFFLGGILIIFQVIIPIIQQISSQQQKNSIEQEKLSDINLSVQLIQSANESDLGNKLHVAVGVLPSEKSITAIYSALTNAAISSGVVFEGFTISPGDIYGDVDKKTEVGVPSVAVSAKISNVTADSLGLFLSSLSNTPPLSQVKDIKLTGGTAHIDLIFYYKPYDLTTINSDIIKPFTQTEEDILRKFK